MDPPSFATRIPCAVVASTEEDVPNDAKRELESQMAREDRRANIELFQLWMNLPSSQKFDPPVVWSAGTSTGTP